MSDFEKWFVEQHGKRPSQRTYNELAVEYQQLFLAAEAARKVMQRCKEWDARRESALYAWNAREKK